MMELQKRRFIFLAWVIWTCWGGIYCLVLFFQTPDIPLIAAIWTSFSSNYVYALLSYGIWKFCNYFSLEKHSFGVVVLFHLGLAHLVTLIWLALLYGLWIGLWGMEVLALVRFNQVVGWQYLFGLFYYIVLAGVFYTIIYYRNFRERELKTAEMAVLVRESELRALRLQMNPHFLFNSLNSVNALIGREPDKARRMIAKLSELLHFSLKSTDRNLIPLREELELVHTYLEIEKVRFEDRLDYAEKIDERLMAREFPALLLQPLIENAVKYGVADSRSGGTIRLDISQQNQRLCCRISNHSPNRVYRLPSPTTGSGTALENARKRLTNLYGNQYRFELDLSRPDTFTVWLEIPINPPESTL